MREEIDVLNRERTIEDLKEILMLLSNNRRGCVFALDGGWGYGKTYILKKLEEELEVIVNPETADDRYYIFHYNCWQYDYYEEPAVAIISAMLEKFNAEIDEKITGVVKDSWDYAKDVLGKIAGSFLENKIGINLVDIYGEIAQNGEERTAATYKFDELFAFKKTLDTTRNKIKELAERKTVVLVVDELDRCMPSYAIKVLERLHHMFDGIDNVVVLLAIDSTQLEHSVREIYGDKIDTERYLKKFISFSMKLNLGQMQESVLDKYGYYFSHFQGIDDVISIIMKLIQLCQIDIRNFDKLIEKLNLVHELVCLRECSAAILLYECIWGLMKYKIYQAHSKGVENVLVYFNRLYWIPEIDRATYGNLDKCFSKELKSYLQELKGKATSDTIVNGMPANQKAVKKDRNGIAWYLLDKVLANHKSFYIDTEKDYRDMVNLCEKYNELGSLLW